MGGGGGRVGGREVWCGHTHRWLVATERGGWERGVQFHVHVCCGEPECPCRKGEPIQGHAAVQEWHEITLPPPQDLDGGDGYAFIGHSPRRADA